MIPCINKRLLPRTYYKAPITYAAYSTKDYYDATMYNYSKGGMYFESEYGLRQGTYLYIKMINFSPDIYVPGAYKAYVAQVRWCKKITDMDAVSYGVGAKFLIKGHILCGKNNHESGCLCDLCGDETSLAQTHRTDDALHLCLSCFQHIGGLTNGKVKESIMKFMIGNVV